MPSSPRNTPLMSYGWMRPTLPSFSTVTLMGQVLSFRLARTGEYPYPHATTGAAAPPGVVETSNRLRVAVAQQPLVELASGMTGQLGREVDAPRALVSGQALGAELQQPSLEGWPCVLH